jgi:hypothetical protein
VRLPYGILLVFSSRKGKRRFPGRVSGILSNSAYKNNLEARLLGVIQGGGQAFGSRIATPDSTGDKQAYPMALANGRGEVLFAWREGAQAAWAVYTKNGKPTRLRGKAGRVPGVHKPTAAVMPDGSFAIVY